MTAWLAARRVNGPLRVGRFKDPTYYLLQPITWNRDPDGDAELSSVTVPVGFVTDFASIPRAFWSLLPPDGEYAYAAAIHDFLYWEQTTSRAAADEVLRSVMRDFGIPNNIIAVIYNAVRLGGQSAWDGNAEQRRNGECRVLRSTPDDPRILWSDWKQRPGICA